MGLEVLTVASYVYVVIRLRHKNQMKRISEMHLNPPVYIGPPSPAPSPRPYHDGRFNQGQGPQAPVGY